MLSKYSCFVLYFILFIFIGSGCNNQEDSVSDSKKSGKMLEHINDQLPLNEFVSWVADTKNELSKSKEITDIDYRICYLPAESMAYMELKNENFSQEQFKQSCKYYTDMSYFNFRIELKQGSGELLKYHLNSPQQYNDRINYMAFGMQKDVFLIQGKDTLYSGLYHFERIFEVAPYATVMLAFDNKKFKREKEFTIVFNDRLFNKGYIKYNYKSNQLIDLPKLSGI